MTATIQRADAEQFAQQWREGHTQHEARIGDRHGFLEVTSIDWLGETPRRFEDAPGEWSTDAIGVHVTIGWHDDEKDVAVEVAKREGCDIVRPRHPDAPLVTAYHGTPAYEPDPGCAVPGRYGPANRSLFLGVPADDGTAIVDFNRATNLPRGCTDLATCPLPPAENKLPVAVEAGGQIPNGRA
jgi:uncharacterized protein